MSMNRVTAAAAAAVLMASTVALGAAEPGGPPPTGCAVQVQPGGVLIVAGYRIWGAQHGQARVHSTASVDPANPPPDMRVSYTWKIGTTYTPSGTRYRFPWATYGKGVMLKALLSGRCGGFSRYYTFGQVGLPRQPSA